MVKGDRQALINAAKFAEVTALCLISVDSEGTIEFANAAACALFGYTRDEMIGRPITIIIPQRMRGAHLAGLRRAADGHTSNLGGRTVEVSALKKDGSEFPIEITLSVWRTSKGFGAGALITDITERRARENRLLRLASQDTLTGLLNRHRFVALLEEAIAASTAATLFLVDLDGFKEVNDTYGHAVGDSLLQAIGVRLPYMLGTGKDIARIGGDEFAILLRGEAEPSAADAQAQAILKAFDKPFELGGHILELGASIGFATVPGHGADAEELIASADFALYRAKADGGHSIRAYDPGMRNESSKRRALRDELMAGFRRGELELFYQPQVDLSSRRIVGLEALIRWRHPTRGLLSPAYFLPALEQSVLALDIGWWTLDEAAKRAGELERGGRAIKIGVNFFPGQLRAPNLSHKVANALQRNGINPRCLEVEITEEVALTNDERSHEAMTALRALGVGIAFDDFGTGFASLSSLHRYPITTLKIDREFVQRILDRPSDAAIAKALVGLGRDMGLETVAEGIETTAQEEALRALGCPTGQGYLYGRPMPFSDVLTLINAEPSQLQRCSARPNHDCL